MLTLPPNMRLAGLPLLVVSTTASASPKLAPHYAPLFEKDRSWTYDVALTNFDYVERKDGTMRAVKMKPERSTFTCKVVSVVERREAFVSEITCDREIDSAYSFQPAGVWIATKAGVFRSPYATLPGGDEEIDVKQPVAIAASPKVARIRKKDDFFKGYFQSSITNPAKGTWCAVADSTKIGGGDGAIETQCFQAGVGISRGKFDYFGGTPRIVEYTVARK